MRERRQLSPVQMETRNSARLYDQLSSVIGQDDDHPLTAEGEE
ncbi:hypothetical protein GRAN_0482 [Granulicella sibirica]|uniref:Uncharacterized protein n=1 Tax=Granulicella sibirica TaxID=2479048 RepID=A0A4Q0T2T8_9BACT|nr:hypothetical protein GRAN_0482 [Granulicella sibirica]